MTQHKTLNDGKVTITQVEAPHRLRTDEANMEPKAWADFAGYPLRLRISFYLRANPGIQDLALYTLFVIVFSIGETPPPSWHLPLQLPSRWPCHREIGSLAMALLQLASRPS